MKYEYAALRIAPLNERKVMGIKKDQSLIKIASPSVILK